MTESSMSRAKLAFHTPHVRMTMNESRKSDAIYEMTNALREIFGVVYCGANWVQAHGKAGIIYITVKRGHFVMHVCWTNALLGGRGPLSRRLIAGQGIDSWQVLDPNRNND